MLAALEPFGIRLGLDRVRRLLSACGAPQRRFPTVLVAGTNGKGSTAALLAAMCEAAGYRCGLYTSPHLEAVTERIAVNGRCITDAPLARHLARTLELAGDEDRPTYFEALTVAALCHFAEVGVDLAVLEVGLGGRLDATNACDPILSLITSIGLDHERHLGSTLSAVAREKCGILRRGRPAIAWGGREEVEQTLCACAETQATSELLLAREEVTIRSEEVHENGQRVCLESNRGAAYRLDFPLLGRHQLENLAVAVLAAERLESLGFSRLDGEAIIRGAERCRWPGRLERIELPGERAVILDGAHNPAGIEALADYVRTLPRRPDLLFGAMAEKAVEAMLPVIAELAAGIVLTAPPAAGAGDPREWMELLRRKAAVIEPEWRKAMGRALDQNRRELLICGSLYLVGAARGYLRERFGISEVDR